MSGLECRLVSLMILMKGSDREKVNENLTTVADAGLTATVFEDPLYNNTFTFIREYWNENGRTAPPTELVVQSEFPGIRLDADVEETADWLAGALQKRYRTNALQDMITAAATTSVEDPGGTLRRLWDEAGKAVQHGGVLHGGPRVWDALDLAPAEQPRWLAKGRLPRGEPCLLIGDEGVGKSLFWILACRPHHHRKGVPRIRHSGPRSRGGRRGMHRGRGGFLVVLVWVSAETVGDDGQGAAAPRVHRGPGVRGGV